MVQLMSDTDHSTDSSNRSAGSNSSTSLSNDTTEKIIGVQHFVLLKRVAENIDRELSLVATFVQRIWHNTDEEINAFDSGSIIQRSWHNTNKEINAIDSGSIRDETTFEKVNTLSKRAFFGYRINDVGADNTGWIKTRRVEMNRGKCKKTSEVNIPLRIEDDYECFPFKIVTASVTVELSSSCTHDQRRRPNLLLHHERKCENISIQGLLPFDLKTKTGNIKDTKDAIGKLMKKKLDDSKSYDFVTPFPEVSYMYDMEKDYCPKFKITFYMVESGISKFVTTVFPMLLIAILNTVSVFDTLQGPIETVNFLGNAASFALTAVFILPSIISESNDSVIFSKNNIYITLVFIGLALSSLPDRMLGTNIPAFCGAAILWLSFVFPLWGFYEYFDRINTIKKQSPTAKDRLSEKSIRNISNYMKTPSICSTFTRKFKKISPAKNDQQDMEKGQNLFESGNNSSSLLAKLSSFREKPKKEWPGEGEYHTVEKLITMNTDKYTIEDMEQFLLLRS